MTYFLVSSPYLLVLGDDRVRGTLEQMTLQVDLVRHRARARLVGKGVYQSFYYVFESIVNF